MRKQVFQQPDSIKLIAKAAINNSNVIHVFDNETDGNYHAQFVAVDWELTHDVNQIFNYTLVSPYRTANILAAAIYAVKNHPLGVSGHNFYYYTQACDEGNSCFENGHLKFNETNRSQKFVITHETGHYLGYLLNQSQSANKSYALNDIYCPSSENPAPTTEDTRHGQYSKEYQTSAAWEGFADFYSVAVWNDDGETDCDILTSENGNIDDCSTEYSKYMETNCGPSNTWPSKGTESDWVYFWWDMHTVFGVSYYTIGQIYDDSNPHTWTASNTYTRLRTAAIDYNGVDESDWDYCADTMNGINH